MGYEDANRKAGIPFYYPLVLFLNIALIIALELLLVYQHPFPLTEELLAKQLPAYENASILRTTDKPSSAGIWWRRKAENTMWYPSAGMCCSLTAASSYPIRS